jgi:GGDEF domain-containing protein
MSTSLLEGNNRMAVFVNFPYNGRMRRPFAVFYIVLTVVFFLGVIGVAAYRLHSAREASRELAVEHFREFHSAVETQLVAAGRIDPTVVKSELTTRLGESADVRTVVMYSLRDGVYYLWAADRNRVELADAATESRAVPDFEVNNISETRFLESISVGNRSVVLESVYGVVESDSAFLILRDSLIAVLGFAVVTLVVAIVSLILHRRRERDLAAVSEEEAHYTMTTEPPAAEVADTAMPAAEAAEAAPVEPEGPPPVEPTAPAAGAATASSSSLFSQQSGVGHREHLEHRLTLELERAAYNEQDLAAALTAFPGLPSGDQAYKQAAELLVERFGFRDLIFEFDEETFCIILPNADLDEAIHLIEDFQRTASGRLPQGTGEPIFGLSARNGRLVDGGRIIREAQSALNRAAGASGRIIGFRPDPQKYRQHVAGKHEAE